MLYTVSLMPDGRIKKGEVSEQENVFIHMTIATGLQLSVRSPEWLLVLAVMRTVAFARLVICMRVTPFLVRIAPVAALPNCC